MAGKGKESWPVAVTWRGRKRGPWRLSSSLRMHRRWQTPKTPPPSFSFRREGGGGDYHQFISGLSLTPLPPAIRALMVRKRVRLARKGGSVLRRRRWQSVRNDELLTRLPTHFSFSVLGGQVARHDQEPLQRERSLEESMRALEGAL